MNEYTKYNTGLRRFCAAIIDSFVFIPLIFLDEFISLNDPNLIIFWQVSISLLWYSYSFIMHYKYGQTLGKMVAGVKVLHISESQRLTFKQVLLRDSIPISIDIAGLIYYFLLLKQHQSIDNVITGYENLTSLVAVVWVAIELITMFTNKKRRALHDFIASTVVIRIENK